MLVLPPGFVLVLLGLIISIAYGAGIAFLSRRRKTRQAPLSMLSSVAVVETALTPVGSVLLHGELWMAESNTGEHILPGQRVRVVTAKNHLLAVEPLEIKSF